jgi:microcystin degradation protein MlrC
LLAQASDIMSRRRILFAGLFHETHTFVPEPTRLADFSIRRGADVLARRGDGSTIDGFIEVADGAGWEIVPVADYGALPAGPVEHGVFEAFWTELEGALRRELRGGGLDGLWLALHGAMVTTECEDPEGELLARIRAVPGAGDLPLFGVFDLHATFTPAMARHANALVAYRENPHTDAREAAVRSARLLERALATGARPRMLSRTAPVIWPPTGTGTADRPMRDLAALARRIEAEDPEIWAVNVIGGYAFSDVPDVGVAFSLATTGATDEAEAALSALVDLAVSLRELGVPREWDLDEALRQIGQPQRGPVILVEPADNIGGGAPGDGTAILRAFLRHKVRNAAVAIADREAVASLRDAEPGDVRRIAVGGRGSALDEGPVEIEVTFVSRSDGHFTLEDRNSHLAAAQGVHFSMGPCAVVTVGEGITVLLTTRKTPPFDLAQLRSQGIVPETLSLIGVKAAVAHRRAYDPIAAASYTVTTPGPCTSDLTQLTYRRVRRPIFPLDPPWRPA